MDKPEIVRVLEVRRETSSVCTLVLDKKVRPQYGRSEEHTSELQSPY